ncbi:oligopeptide transporter, OPT family [candidate division WOR-3 bacterium]|nr:oligopeptide transporter, OPT family [candidate division WOR-3 bacterium]MCK4528047.1 oligopeptide transporter, OPT family [candidate division WOR-3 bacterium]
MVRELTIRAVILGIILSVVMAAANTYLGLYAGMTVSASIPAAVISMGILRGIFRKGTILENNIIQTSASAGESLAAGIIFTIPALVIVGAWLEFDFWATTLVALLGGLLGILFMIPLRKALIVEEKELIYPEGVACAEVLKAGEEEGGRAKHIFIALTLGFIFKFGITAFSIIKGTVEKAVLIRRSLFYLGSDLSVALLGVGYIVGFNVSILVFLGGAIGWLIGIPIYSLYHPISGNLIDATWDIWSSNIRFMGVGAMIVGGLWSIVSIRHGIKKGIKELFGKMQSTEDLPKRVIFALLSGVVVSIFLLYLNIIKTPGISLLSTILMAIASFFFVAVSSYIVGLVGSSNNPVSGMIISTLLFTSILMLLVGMEGSKGMIAALIVAGVVGCATCTAGDVSQDLKTGWIVGAMPRRQQIAQIIGVLSASFIIVPVLTLLHNAYGIGTGEPGALQAPQASLFASIVKGFFIKGGGLPWNMVIIGCGLAVILIITDEFLKGRKSSFRTYVMPVAVGIYLPLTLSVPILIGGMIRYIVKKSDKGILLSSGLIAGEALAGVVIAGMIYGGFSPITILESNPLSLLVFGGFIIYLFLIDR